MEEVANRIKKKTGIMVNVRAGPRLQTALKPKKVKTVWKQYKKQPDQ
jgi:accessory colonization factor AcfC